MNYRDACALREIAATRGLAQRTVAKCVFGISAAASLAIALGGCSSSISAKIPASPATGPQLYMVPTIYEGSPAVPAPSGSSPSTFSIDDAATTFAQQTYAFNDSQSGPKVYYSGRLISLDRGLEQLEISYAPGITNLAQAGSGWAVELAGQGGGLAQLPGQSFVPLVPAVTCPSMSSAKTFLFVTLPTRLITTGTGKDTWNPILETAYGSVDISASGSAVTFANIKRNTLAGTQLNPPVSAPTGTCSSTVFGNTVAVPANPTITIDPTGNPTISPQAMIGIGPSGLLVEDNGSEHSFQPAGTFYEDILGAGTGAIGLPQPSATVDPSALAGAQYQGFFYGSGSSGSTTNWSSSVASFGFPGYPTLPASCASMVSQTGSLSHGIYGGDFVGNNPGATTVQSETVGGFGNCDFAIDLGATQPINGLFTGANVYVGAGFGKNTTGYSFSAVAIAGQLKGKYAIFLIGVDNKGSPNQAWGIYLLQSN